MQNRPIRFYGAALFLFLLGPRAFGQAAAGAPPVPASEKEKEIIALSPFTVNAEEDTGYVATSSLMGSRLNTPLRDTAASVSVLTSEFLSDIAATDFTEALQWANNVQLDVGETIGVGDDNGPVLSYAQFRVRGIPATVTRNFFPLKVSTDTFNIDRIEEQRGPNSILFGIGSAGGILNASTKQAVFGPDFRRAGLQTGSYDSFRGTLDVNQGSFNHRLAVRVNAVYQDNGSWREHAFNRTNRIHLTGTLKLTDKTALRAEYETGDIKMGVARGTSPWDGLQRWLVAGKPTVASATGANLAQLGLVSLGTAQRITYISNTNKVYNMANQLTSNGINTGNPLPETLSDRSINVGGPGQTRGGGYNAVSVFLSHRLATNTFGELSFNHQDDNTTAHMAGIGRSENNRLKADPMQFLPDGSANPNVGRYFLEGDRWTRNKSWNRSDNTRLQLSHEQDLGKWGNYRLAGMGEYRWSNVRGESEVETWAGSPFSSNPDNAANVVWRRTYVQEGQWGTYFVSAPNVDGFVQNLPNPAPGGTRPATLSSAWITRAAPNDTVDYMKTALLGGQARYLKNRLVVGVGYRRDHLNRTERQSVREGGVATGSFVTDYSPTGTFQRSTSANTKTLGVVGHVTKNISLFYNYSNSFDLAGTVRVLPTSRTAGNSQSKGEDYGVSFALLNDRVTLRVNRYTTDVKGSAAFAPFGSTGDNPTVFNNTALRILIDNGFITQAQANARMIDTSGSTYDRLMEGYEANLTANLTKNWRLQANYSYTRGSDSNIAPEVKAWAPDAIAYYRSFAGAQNIVGSDGRTIPQVISDWQTRANDAWDLEGITLKGNRRHKWSLFTRYNLPWQQFRGAFIGGGYRYVSRSELSLDANDQIMYGNAYYLTDALVGWRFSKVPFLKHGITFQLNINNLLDWQKPIDVSLNADGSRYHWSILEPRAWRLSANLQF